MHKDYETRTLKQKIWLQTTGVFLAILFVLSIIINAAGLIAGNAFYKEFCVWHTRFDARRFNSLQETLDEGIKNKNWQNISFKSRQGYILQGTYLPNPKPTNNTVVFVHGIASSRLMGVWYAPIYWSAGYNVLVYDSRASGASGGESVTWGIYERYDLDQWIDWVEQHNPGGIIGVHGVSMGAATALMHAEINESTHRVKFYVADSAYSDLTELFTQQINNAVNLHSTFWIRLLLWYSSLAANWQSGFRFQDVSPVQSVKTATTPTLFLHGEADALVPQVMCEQLYAASSGYKKMYVFPKDAHAMAIFNHKQEYQQQIINFISALP
ncbi:alpha/beta fold hydrolase [Sporomusa aerivorans]|uniref:alpha/beta fold hydrolase n=1 Tax=Sporomusa aerivorans TaxID=204936 RepID=UPI00352AF756